ncbi:hypothetical protein [Streptomyces sp. EMB24]|uniref:hypothetical protein n=1 Tax=Streptomyces sp. EMB24 TaxID=2835531 RepID=UPI00227B3196|nr:hypothetical protein [Streptomyces sp. EMB24]
MTRPTAPTAVNPSFSGINPNNLLRTMQDLESDSKILLGATTSYRPRFHGLGLDTEALTEISRIARWVDDELPILRRRHALASAMEVDERGHKGSMVQLREPVLSIGVARRDGTELAAETELAANLSRDEAAAEFHRIAEVLAVHKGDPDFTSAFFAGLDPQVLKNLPVMVVAADASTAEADAKVFGSAFSTAVASASPAPGFSRAVALFHGDIGEDEPTALFSRALMQGDDKDLWAVAWRHTTLAAKKLGDLADTWSDSAGLLASVVGMQAKYAGHFWKRSQQFSDEASRLYQQRVNSMSPDERRKFKKDTRRAARNARQYAREAERVYSKYGLGAFSRLMEASVADGGSWLIGKVPGLRPPNSTTLFGRTLHTAGKLPLLGTALTVSAIGWDISQGEEKDVAIAANTGGMVAGGTITWGTTALVTAAGGPVSWGIAAGVALGFGVGYGISYGIKTDKGRVAVNAVTDAAKDVGEEISDVASSTRRMVSGWLS